MGREYETPTLKIIVLGVQGIICQSGNESMWEIDLGDGGFSEE